MTISVTPVRGRSDTTAFIRLPYSLYRADPHWVAPLERERRDFLNPRRNPFYGLGTVQLFLARRGGMVVGRIAAIVDPRFQDRHDPKCGQFGLFESVDDAEVAAALYGAAADWLGERGLSRMLGPLSFSTNDECGVLVEGFDSPPTTLMPHNPPYYSRLFTDCGFAEAKDLLSWRITMPPDGEPPAAILRAAERALGAPGVRVRPLDPQRFDADMAAVKEIYNDAWAENYASVPMSDSEFAYCVRRLKPILKPELLQIVEVYGEPAAYTLWLPDTNQALCAARGRLTSYGLPIALVRITRAGRRINRTRAVTSGIKEEHRLRGLMAVLLTETQRAAFRLGYTETELSWILADNHHANRYAQAFGGSHFRTHRLYERDLGGLR
ncbi:N-acetyltransferase [Streptomyces gobiensis]|uniref:N-acetyltransferase n=1 Tax=Streptomyces gobiensis TaxID=2875706 RepID=UPI001E596B78|nr:N-acetyltransferase [Streptomyces gobiensis]UGY91520.1 N-acetyltransferase [Streptomyces gobiensis]